MSMSQWAFQLPMRGTNPLLPHLYLNLLTILENAPTANCTSLGSLVCLSEIIGKSFTQRSRRYKEHKEEGREGKAIVETLAKDLQVEFPGVTGYSADNLWRMRKFYINYANKPKLAPLVQEIAWAHNIIIMEKCKNDLSREYYLRMAKKFERKM